jgi:aspartate/methionine/tyrosine aminotransferase
MESKVESKLEVESEDRRIINIGHGDPTIFRDWWEANRVLPWTDTQFPYFYEYQEDDPVQLIAATHQFHRIFGTDSPSSWLAYGNGSTQVIHATLYALTKLVAPNRKLVVGYRPPVYMLMHEYLSHCGFVEVTFDLTRTDLDVEIVIDPNNPTGEHRRQQSSAPYVIFDRAYNWPIYCDKVIPTSIAKNHITVYTISKALGMGGLRLGWAFINDMDLIEEIKRAIFVIGICPNSFGMSAATKVFNLFQEDPSLSRRYTSNLKSEIAARMNRTKEYKQFEVTNTSGPYAWIRSKDGTDIAAYLFDHHGIAVKSGKYFGSTADYARLSLICSGEDFFEAMDRLKDD